MTLLDRYLLKQFSRQLFLVLGSLISIYLLVDFFERIDNFLEAGKTVGLAVRYLFLKVPLMVEQLLPVSILLAGVITLGLLSHSREFLALKAGGICVSKVVRPLIGGGVIFTMLGMASSQWLLPPTTSASNTILLEEVKKQAARGIERQGRTFYRGEQGIYSFARSELSRDDFTAFSYAAWDDKHKLVMFLSAKAAVYRDGVWSFTDGQLKERGVGGEFTTRIFDHLTLPLPDEPGEFFVRRYGVNESSLMQLYEKASRKKGGGGRQAWIQFHQRLSYLCLGLPLLLLGLPVLLLVQQRWGRDLTLAIPISCGLAFAAWGWWSAAQAMSKASYLQPGISAWIMHLLATVFGIVLLRRQDR